MSPDIEQIRARAAAARLISALAHPDVARVVGALPTRPGEGSTLADLARTTGLAKRALAAAISKGRDSGALCSPAPGLVGVDRDRLHAIEHDLTASNPLAAVAAEPELDRWVRFGRIVEVPDDVDRVERLCRVVARLLPDTELSEAEVNHALEAAADDYATWRRLLVDHGLLRRSPDGRHYRPVSPTHAG